MEIKIVKQILEWNEDVSNELKKLLAEKKIALVNVMGSPGAGKTSLSLISSRSLAKSTASALSKATSPVR